MKSVLAYPYIFESTLNYGEIMENQLLTSSEVAEWLHMDEATVRRMSRDGKLPAVKIGRCYRYRQADLDEWYSKQLRKGNGDEKDDVI